MIGFAALIAAAVSPFAPQPVIVGPFPLGDLILTSPNSDWLVKDFKAAGLDLDDVKKQMNGWKVTLIDSKIRKQDGGWKWYRPDRGGWGPKVLVEGRFSIEVKDPDGKKVEIALTECEPVGTSTDNGGGERDSPANVRCPVLVKLRFHGLRVPEESGIISIPKEGNTLLPPIRYDMTGRSGVEKPAPKK